MAPKRKRCQESLLVVEDNPADQRLIRESLKEVMPGLPAECLTILRDGLEALAWLRGEPPFDSAGLPCVILLDLNLPRMDGRELLQEIKNDEKLRRIPVIILTTSNAEEDIETAYDRHANCFVRKPVEYDDFIRVMETIRAFWFQTACLPSTEHQDEIA